MISWRWRNFFGPPCRFQRVRFRLFRGAVWYVHWWTRPASIAGWWYGLPYCATCRQLGYFF